MVSRRRRGRWAQSPVPRQRRLRWPARTVRRSASPRPLKTTRAPPPPPPPSATIQVLGPSGGKSLQSAGGHDPGRTDGQVDLAERKPQPTTSSRMGMNPARSGPLSQRAQGVQLHLHRGRDLRLLLRQPRRARWCGMSGTLPWSLRPSRATGSSLNTRRNEPVAVLFSQSSSTASRAAHHPIIRCFLAIDAMVPRMGHCCAPGRSRRHRRSWRSRGLDPQIGNAQEGRYPHRRANST